MIRSGFKIPILSALGYGHMAVLPRELKCTDHPAVGETPFSINGTSCLRSDLGF